MASDNSLSPEKDANCEHMIDWILKVADSNGGCDLGNVPVRGLSEEIRELQRQLTQAQMFVERWNFGIRHGFPGLVRQLHPEPVKVLGWRIGSDGPFFQTPEESIDNAIDQQRQEQSK